MRATGCVSYLTVGSATYVGLRFKSGQLLELGGAPVLTKVPRWRRPRAGYGVSDWLPE